MIKALLNEFIKARANHCIAMDAEKNRAKELEVAQENVIRYMKCKTADHIVYNDLQYHIDHGKTIFVSDYKGIILNDT